MELISIISWNLILMYPLDHNLPVLYCMFNTGSCHVGPDAQEGCTGRNSKHSGVDIKKISPPPPPFLLPCVELENDRMSTRFVEPAPFVFKHDSSSRGPAKRLTNILPSLRKDDPIVQYLGLTVGDIVRVDRQDGSVYYRLVIPTK
jgi:hypothetical protein